MPLDEDVSGQVIRQWVTNSNRIMASKEHPILAAGTRLVCHY